MKRCLAIGDLFVPPEAMAKGLEGLKESSVDISTREFSVGDFEQLQRVNHLIEQQGPGVVELPGDLVDAMMRADLLVVHFCPVSQRLIERHGRLKIIGTCRTGLSNIDTQAAKAKGVAVVNCRGRLANAVADFTVGIMICEARNIARGHAGLRRGEWIRRYSNLGQIPDLPGRTAGLIGLGAIGQATARRLGGFDMNIVAYDPYVDPAIAQKLSVTMVPLEEVMRTSDFISLHVDLREQTRNLIGRREVTLMKPTAYFINTARAGVVDEEALIEALREGKIAGAALDVFENEPIPDGHPFLTLPNVTITPHMAGGSDDAFRNSPKLRCEQLMDML